MKNSITRIAVLASSLTWSLVADGAEIPAIEPQPVYAKVLLELDKPVTPEHVLEPWIAKELAGRSKANFAAMSHGARVGEKAAGARHTTIWDGIFENRTCGCPAWAQIVERAIGGNVTVDIDGFRPVATYAQGRLPSQPGSRTVVDADLQMRVYVLDETPAAVEKRCETVGVEAVRKLFTPRLVEARNAHGEKPDSDWKKHEKNPPPDYDKPPATMS